MMVVGQVGGEIKSVVKRRGRHGRGHNLGDSAGGVQSEVAGRREGPLVVVMWSSMRCDLELSPNALPIVCIVPLSLHYYNSFILLLSNDTQHPTTKRGPPRGMWRERQRRIQRVRSSALPDRAGLALAAARETPLEVCRAGLPGSAANNSRQALLPFALEVLAPFKSCTGWTCTTPMLQDGEMMWGGGEEDMMDNLTVASYN